MIDSFKTFMHEASVLPFIPKGDTEAPAQSTSLSLPSINSILSMVNIKSFRDQGKIKSAFRDQTESNSVKLISSLYREELKDKRPTPRSFFAHLGYILIQLGHKQEGIAITDNWNLIPNKGDFYNAIRALFEQESRKEIYESRNLYKRLTDIDVWEKHTNHTLIERIAHYLRRNLPSPWMQSGVKPFAETTNDIVGWATDTSNNISTAQIADALNRVNHELRHLFGGASIVTKKGELHKSHLKDSGIGLEEFKYLVKLVADDMQRAPTYYNRQGRTGSDAMETTARPGKINAEIIRKMLDKFNPSLA